MADEEEDFEDPYRAGSAGEGSRGFPNRPGLQRSVQRRLRSGRDLSPSQRRQIDRIAENQHKRDQGRDFRDFAIDAINERAPGHSVSQRTSPADFEKVVNSVDGTGLSRSTPGIDAYKQANSKEAVAQRMAKNRMQNDRSGGEDPYSMKMRRAVEQTAAEIRANKAEKPVPAPRKTPTERVSAIAENLKPGDFIGVKEGNTAAMSQKLPDGTTDTKSVTMPNRIASGPGMVRDESGKMVPIREETARLAAQRAPAIDAADRAATETADYLNRMRDSDPAVQLRRKVKEYQASRARSRSSRQGAGSVVAGASRPASSQDPYRIASR